VVIRSFTVKILVDRRHRQYQVEQIYADARKERFRIIGKDKSVVLENNRPLVRGKGLRTFPVKWKVIEGTVRVASALDPFIKAIMQEVDQ
jgi:hypothetical protein